MTSRWISSTALCALWSFLVASAIFPRPLEAQRDLREALKALDGAVDESDFQGFESAAERALETKSLRGLKATVDAYGLLVEGNKKLRPEIFYRLHLAVAKLISNVQKERLVRELESLQKKAKRWPSRLLILDAAALHANLDLRAAAMAALQDEDPRVIRRAASYLRNSQTLPVVDAVLARYLKLESRSSSLKGPEWNRTRLACRDALHRLLKVSLPAAVDYKNYLAARRDGPDLFDPQTREDAGKTRLSLFGAEITGKNVVFLVDVSGSMMATDEITYEGTTVVGDPRKAAKTIDARRRINRTKKELENVIRNLPEDRRLNVFPFSTVVERWKETLVFATPSNKRDAIKYVRGLVAEGITVTDEALEEAFRDLYIDTVYLITDGAPTHKGSVGPERPSDSDELIEAIHKRVRHLNFLRGVRIFSLGFPEADEEFLKKLSGENSGAYTPIR